MVRSLLELVWKLLKPGPRQITPNRITPLGGHSDHVPAIGGSWSRLICFLIGGLEPEPEPGGLVVKRRGFPCSLFGALAIGAESVANDPSALWA